MFNKIERATLLDNWVRTNASRLSHVTEKIMVWAKLDVTTATSHLGEAPRDTITELWDSFDSDALRGLLLLAVNLVHRYVRQNARMETIDRDSVLCVHWLLSDMSADPTLLGLQSMASVRPTKKPDGTGYYHSRLTLAGIMYDLWPGWSKPWTLIVEDALNTIEGQVNTGIPNHNDTLLTTAQIAARSGCSRDTVLRAIQSGCLTATKPAAPGGRATYTARVSDVQKWEDAGRPTK